MQPLRPGPGDPITVTIHLRTAGPALPNVRITDTLPSELTYAGELWASSGVPAQADDTITWHGGVSSGAPVTLTFRAAVDAAITEPRFIRNTTLIDDGVGRVWAKDAAIVANGYGFYLPLILRDRAS
jgi:uncharacterized repeat protein (TIGR01451 family)